MRPGKKTGLREAGQLIRRTSNKGPPGRKAHLQLGSCYEIYDPRANTRHAARPFARAYPYGLRRLSGGNRKHRIDIAERSSVDSGSGLLKDLQLLPPFVLLRLRGIGVFVILQPEPKPVEISS